MGQLKGGELANCGGDTVAEVADQAQHGIQRICDSDSLVVGFLAHTGLSLDNESSPQRERIKYQAHSGLLRCGTVRRAIPW